MHKSLAMIFLLFFSCISLAQKKNTADETILPLRFDTGNPAPYGLPSTVITIQSKTLPVIMDTGLKNGQLILSKYALKNLHVKYTRKKICFQSFEAKYCLKEFVVPEVKLGSFTVKNVKGGVMTKFWGAHDQNFKETEASKNGVIGFTLISKFNLLLDYANAKAVLIKPESQPVNINLKRWVAVPFTGDMISQLKLNGKTINIGWDIAAIPSMISKEVAANFKNVPCTGNAPYAKKDCMSVETITFTTDKDEELPNTWFKLKPFPEHAPAEALIGNDFFRENLVYFDFKNQHIYIKHNNVHLFQDID